MATDTNGWTVFTPSADTHKVYVSNSIGSDANDGLSESTPVKTLAMGLSLIRDGSPDWLLLKAGDTWTGEALDSVPSGRSAAEPMLISSWGSGARPVVEPNPNVNGAGILSVGGPGHGGDFLAVVGIEFYNYTDDPANPSFDPTNHHIVGAVFLNPVTSVLIEDCKFSFFSDNIDVTPLNPTPDSTVTIRRNVIVDSYSIDSHSQGILIDSVAYPVIQENVLDHNGWNVSVAGADPTPFNQAIYITAHNGPAIVTGNIIANASANGLQARSGGFVDDNLFVHNPVAGFVASTPSSVTDNVILEGINNANIANSWGFFVNGGASGSVVQNNIAAHSISVPPSFAFDIESGDSGVTLTNNIVYSWGSSRQILDNGSGDITTPNAIDLTGYPDPNRSVGSYNSTLGGTATLEAFLSEARLQSKDNWHLQYTADAVNDYIRAGFGITDKIADVQNVIEANGSTRLTEVGNHFFLYDSGGSGPSLKYAGTDYLAGQFGACAPIGAEQTANGYEVAWRVMGTDQYIVWNTDSSGNYSSSMTGVVSGADYALESLETSFHQDLNHDGLWLL